jgi:hypothetical protein
MRTPVNDVSTSLYDTVRVAVAVGAAGGAEECADERKERSASMRGDANRNV